MVDMRTLLNDGDTKSYLRGVSQTSLSQVRESATPRQGFGDTIADAQIAAVARSREAALATRNVADFEGCGIDVVDPWRAPRTSIET
jgi:hypothetical protein